MDYGSTHLTFEERTCRFCADQEAYARVVAERDDEAIPRGKDGQPAWPDARTRRPADGRHLYIRPLTAEEMRDRGITRPA